MAPGPGDKYWNGAIYKEGVMAALLELKTAGGVDLNSIRKHFDANTKPKLRSYFRRYVRKALSQLIKSGEVVETSSKHYKYIPPKLSKKMKDEKSLEAPIRPRNTIGDEYMLVLSVLREMHPAGGSDLESMLKFVKDTYSEEELHYDHKRLFTSFLEGMVMDGKVVKENDLYKLSDETLKCLPDAAAEVDFTGFNI